MRIFFQYILVFSILHPALIGSAHGLESYTPEPMMMEAFEKWNNPAPSFDGEEVPGRSGGSTVLDVADDLEAAYVAVYDRMLQRKTKFGVRLTYPMAVKDIEPLAGAMLQDIVGMDDYLRFHVRRLEARVAYKRLDDIAKDIVLEFGAAYMTTMEQERYVDDVVTKTLDSIIAPGMNRHRQMLTVHDWIVNNVEYDRSRTRFTAYDALKNGNAVCQGYALLAHKMFNALGINATIITGRAGREREPHAWNLVEKDGVWRHMDVTYDDPIIHDRRGNVLSHAQKKARKIKTSRSYFMLTSEQLRAINKDMYRRWSVSSYPDARGDTSKRLSLR